jgi:hypothetical protein
VGEETSQGITRRDLLRRGAVLGGAVVWATPVVQTLGMGRAFAQTASPVENGGGGKDVSYAAISWECGGQLFKVKWEPDSGFSTKGALPDCGNIGGSYASSVPAGLAVQINTSNPACIVVDVPGEDAFNCTAGAVTNVKAWVKAGSSSSSLEPCHPTSLSLGVSGQTACSSAS